MADAQSNQAPVVCHGLTRQDGWRLAVLLLLTLALHLWLMSRAATLARDGVGFIRYALQLEQRPWSEVVASSHQHPLYPMTVLAISLPVRRLMGGTSCDAMVLSAQLAAAIAGILLVIPMYLLGRSLFDRRVGFWAAALFQCLPVSARILSDTLSDPLCLFFIATGLYLGVRALATGSAWRFAACGVCSGLAYLTRPEGLVVVAAVGLVLLAWQSTRRWQQSWRHAGTCALSLILGLVLVASPFVAATGRLSTKPSAQGVMQLTDAASPGCVTTGPLLAVTWSGAAPSDLHSLGWGLGALAKELVRAFQYLSWLPALIGLWWLRRRLRDQPGLWVLLVVCGIYAAVLVRLSLKARYVGERHVQLLVLCGTFWAVATVAALGDWLAARSNRHWAAVLLVALVCFGLPTLGKPLHATQAGYRQAGLWISAHSQPGDQVIDPHNIAYFYSGRVFQEAGQPSANAGGARFVVLMQPSDESVPGPLQQLVQEVVHQNQIVFHYPLKRGKGQDHAIVVYEGRPAATVVPTEQGQPSAGVVAVKSR